MKIILNNVNNKKKKNLNYIIKCIINDKNKINDKILLN